MWVTNENQLIMAEGDYGIALPITVNGVTFDVADTLKMVIKTKKNGDVILEKEFENIEDNTVDLILTEAESAELPIGSYVYYLDWYQNGVFLCNLVLCAPFKVVDKA